MKYRVRNNKSVPVTITLGDKTYTIKEFEEIIIDTPIEPMIEWVRVERIGKKKKRGEKQ